MMNIRGLALAILGIVALWSAQAFAQRPESATSQLFPQADRVFADFKDDAERWVVCEALYSASMEKLPNGQYKASLQKSGAYQQAMGSIVAKYEQMGQDAPASKEFFTRIENLRRDGGFRRKALDRYGVGSLATASPQDLEPRVQKSGEQLTREAAPYWFATLILMWLAARFLAATGGNGRAQDGGGGGGLPESLRGLSILGRTYAVEADSGIVVDEKSWTDTEVTVHTTPGHAQTIGDTLYVTMPTHETHTSTVRQDRIWLRDGAGRESAWNLRGGVLETRVGHVLSRVGRRAGGQMQFLMACNHNTGQIVTFPGAVASQHGASFFRAWTGAALVGTAGFLFGGWSLIPLIRPEETFMWNAIGLGGLGLIGSTVFGFLIALFSASRVIKRRNAEFSNKYVPLFREWFQQNTPSLMSRFAAHR
jgi:hypothetical protein